MRYPRLFAGTGLIFVSVLAMGGPRAVAAAAKATSTPVRRAAFAGTPYRHPLGFALTYPAGWRLREGEGAGLQLLPGDPDPLELYLVITDSAQGIARVDDP